MKNSEASRALRSFLRLFILLAALYAHAPVSHAQRRTPPAARRNPTIARVVSEVSARNIESTIRKLVSFGTRNTLSAQDDPARGIGAARDWLYGEFQKISASSGGRMTVEKQS